ncbi:MAG TPA: helix-turn-helix domain-containing protein [Sphingopyxis sp.]|nr:helix-turn-helix domain-containing protein [Sphingopyxis sp.]HMQ17740.1 helix-turn-helix domain-containing protein [Sphingopyxis sp.]
MASEAKIDRAVVAAADQFIRYGFARTTMGDIARAAEMSRPALYLLFPGKEELFEAAVEHLNRIRLAEIRGALARTRGLPDRLFTACDLWLVQVFDLQRRTPDARDMDDLSIPVVRRVYAELEALIAELIEAEAAKPLPASAAQLARGLVFAVRGLGAAAGDVETFRAMARLQVDLLCRALG